MLFHQNKHRDLELLDNKPKRAAHSCHSPRWTPGTSSFGGACGLPGASWPPLRLGILSEAPKLGGKMHWKVRTSSTQGQPAITGPCWQVVYGTYMAVASDMMSDSNVRLLELEDQSKKDDFETHQ